MRKGGWKKMTNGLFKPELTEKLKQKYFYERLNKKKNELKKEGLEGQVYGKELHNFTEMLKKEIANGIIIQKMELTPARKRSMREYLAKTGKTLTTAKNTHYELPNHIRTHTDFVHHVVRKEGMFSRIFPTLKKFEGVGRNKCILYPKNTAWISKGEDGIYRYFTKREGGRYAFFSILDMMEINYGKGVGLISGLNYARREIARVLNASYYGLEFELETQAKYVSNIERIELEGDLKRDYPSLYKLVGKQLYILLKLHTIALASVIDKKTAIKKQAVFFASTRLLQEQFEAKSHTTFSKAINLFATLNLIDKHDPKGINTESKLYETALQIRSENEYFNLINFLSIPLYDDSLLAKAEKTAKRLIKNKITNMDLITRKSLTTAINEKKANEVYGQAEFNIDKLSTDELYKLAQKHAPEYPDFPDDIE